MYHIVTHHLLVFISHIIFFVNLHRHRFDHLTIAKLAKAISQPCNAYMF